MSGRQSLNYVLLAVVLDVLGTLGVLKLAAHLEVLSSVLDTTPAVSSDILLPVFGLTFVIWLVVFFASSVYDPNRSLRAIDELQNVTIATLFALLVLSGTLYLTYRTLPRTLFIQFLLLDMAWVVGWRMAVRLTMRLLDRRIYRERRVLIAGANMVGKQTADTIRDHTWTGLQMVGYVDNDATGKFSGMPVFGRLDEIQNVVARENINEVVIALPYREYENMNRIVADLQTLPVQVRVVPDYFNLALFRASVEDFGGLPLINLRDPAMTKYQRLIKRAFDVAVSAVALVLTLPTMIGVAIAIRLDSPGPVVFRQKRVGENGKEFTMYKFRSMVADAEAKQHLVTTIDEQGRIIHKAENDPRITRIGHFIRRTSLDELPQLLNVLKGDMSLIGPRPEMPWLVEKYEPWQRKRFAVPQGITGWWQVNGRSDKPMHLHTEDDLYYIQNYSLLLDLQILWRTLGAVFKRHGAY